MTTRFGTPQPDLSRLRSTLMTSGLQTRDNPTFQTINGLIDATQGIQNIINANVSTNTGDISAVQNSDILTWSDESVILPNSRNLLAGLGITFNDVTVNQRTISVTPHALLDGSINNDTVAQSPFRGSLIYGNVTPKWDELVIGANARVLRSNGTDISWSQVVLTTDVTGRLPYVNFVSPTTTSLLVGRGDSVGVDFQEITLGAGLAMTGTVLSSTSTGAAIGGAVTGGLDKSILFISPAGVLAQNNTSFLWDDSTLQFILNTLPFSSPESGSLFIGLTAGDGAVGATASNFIGAGAGFGAIASTDSNFFGINSGNAADSANGSNFFGNAAGLNASGAFGSNFFGDQAGSGSVGAFLNNFFGVSAGQNSIATNSNFFGSTAGLDATFAYTSNFIGPSAGTSATTAANSTFIGNQAGFNDTVDNTGGDFSSILIGNYTNTGGFSDSISMGQGTMNSAVQQFNIGNAIYGINIYNGITPSSTPVDAFIGIGIDIPTSVLHVYRDNATPGNYITHQNPNATGDAGFALLTDGFIGGFFLNSSGVSYGAFGATMTGLYNAFGAGITIIADDPTGIINFATGGNSEVGRIDAVGNFGLGTPMPAFIVDLYRAQAAVAGNTYARIKNDNPAGDAGVRLETDAGTVGGFFLNSSGNSYGAFGASMTGIYNSLGGVTLLADGASGIINFASGGNAEVARFNANGNFGLRVTTPTAYIHIAAGTVSAGTAPLKFNSGSLLTTAEAGAIEFLTDKFYGTITTGAARKELTLNDAALTSGRVPFATTNGRLTSSANLTFVTDTLTVAKIIASSSFTTSGSFATAYIQKAVDYTATATDFTIDVTVSGKTITLPTCVGISGRIYVIKNTSSGNITLNTTSSQTIFDTSAVTSITVLVGESYMVQSDDANWIVI